MKHNEYEFLLNNIYYREVKSTQGISADVFRNMQIEYGNLNRFALVKGEHHSDFAFKKSFLIVRTYVQQAIKDGLRNFQLAMEATDVSKLNYIMALLNRNFFDKRGLDQIIATANNVFKQYK